MDSGPEEPLCRLSKPIHCKCNVNIVAHMSQWVKGDIHDCDFDYSWVPRWVSVISEEWGKKILSPRWTKDDRGCCAFSSPYSCINMARTMAIVKLLTDQISCAARVLRKCIWRLYKHSFQRREPRGLWCDWQPMWLQSGRNPKDNVQRPLFINYMAGLEVACVSFRRICTYTDNLLLKSFHRKETSQRIVWLSGVFPIKRLWQFYIYRSFISFVCVCVCVVTIPAHHLARWWISFRENASISASNLQEKHEHFSN